MAPDPPRQSTLRIDPPEQVRRRFAQLADGADGAEPLLYAIPTDRPLSAGARVEWILVSPRRLTVISENGTVGDELNLPLERISAIENEESVGAGLIRAVVDGEQIDVAEYRLARSGVFARLASRLEQLRRGEAPPAAESEPEPALTHCDRCGLMLPEAGGACPRCRPRGAVLWRVLHLMRPHARAGTAMLALLLIGVGLDLISPQLTRILVDRVLAPAGAAGGAGVGGPSPAEGLRTLSIVVATLAVVQTMRAGVNIVNGSLAAKVGTAITYDIRARLVDHLQRLSVGFYDRQQVGSLVGRVAYDTEAMHGFIWQLTGGFILQIVMVVGVFIMMFTLDWQLALMALLPAPLVMGSTIYYWKRVYPRYYRVWEASSRQAGGLTGMLAGVRVVKLFGQEQREADRFNFNSGRLRAARFGVDGATAVFSGSVGLFFQIGGWIVWYAGGREVLDGRLSLGQLMAFFGYLWMFYGPLAALPQLTSWFTQFTTQAGRIFDVLDTPETITPPAEPVKVAPVQGEIVFENVTFGYDRHSPVIRNLNLRIAPGERVGIVGPSGSGKTSLIQLLCRFYDPQEGRITLDGVDIRRIAKDELRRSLGLVLQEPFLFRGTIAENIAYAEPDATPEQIIEAAACADCHDFILRQPHAYDTWLGERGAGLSGGERQRIGIARTLLSNPPILILDEATSSVDATSEAVIRAALDAWTARARSATAGEPPSRGGVIAIAHRLASLRDMDRIVVLDGGRLVEEGAPADLLAAGGDFAKLCQAQGLRSFDPAAPGDLPPPPTLRWLTPDDTTIAAGPRGMLSIATGGSAWHDAYAIRCMPIHEPTAMISIRRGRRDARGSEIGLIANKAQWPDHARLAIRRSLARRYLVRRITAIHSIELAHNYLNFQVDTDAGPARFVARWSPESVQEHGASGGGRMIVDSEGEHYLIRRLSDLPPRDRDLLQRYVYW